MSLVKFDFSRTGKKHVVNKDLLLEEVDDNIAGVAHKPSTIAKNTNLLVDSEDIINSDSWYSITYNKVDNELFPRNTIEEDPSIEPPINGIKVYKVTKIDSGSIYVRPKDMFIYPDVNYVFSIYVKGGDGTISSSLQEWLVGVNPSDSSQAFPLDFRYTLSSVDTPSVTNNGATHYEIEELDGDWFRVVVAFKINRDQYEDILNSITNNDESWVDRYFKYRFITFYPTISQVDDFVYFAGQQLYTVTDEDIQNQDIIRDYVSTTSFDESIDSSNEQSVFRGIKPQRQSSNTIDYSSDFSQNWVSGDSNFTITQSSIADPKGELNAYKLEYSGSGTATSFIERPINEPTFSSQYYKTFSVFAKAGDSHQVILNYTHSSNGNVQEQQAIFDLLTGSYVFDRNEGKHPRYAGSEYIGNGWYRIYIACNIRANNDDNSSILIYASNDTSKTSQKGPVSIYVFGAQVENINLDIYPEPSDYIETQASPLSVSEEIISLSNASNYINVSEQTIFLEFEIPKQYGASTLFSLSNSLTVSPSLEIIFTTNEYGQNKIKFRNFIEGDLEPKEIFIPESGDTVSLAFSYDPNSITIYINETEALNVSPNSYFIYSGIFDKIEIGRFFSNNASNAYIKSFAIFRRKLSDDNLQNVTTGDALKELKPFTLTYLFGLFPTAKYAGYSLKHINSIYLGPIVKVRRSSDNATLDVYQDNGWVDMLEIEQFSSFTDNVYVETWYDQSGNGNHITNADTTKQPMIYQGGVGLIKINENPACYFDGVNDSLNATFSTPIGADKELCTFILAKPSSVSDSTIAGFKDSDPGARAGSHRNIVINSGDIQIQTDVSEYTGSNNAQVDVPFLFSSFMLDGVTEVFTNGIFHGQTFNTNMSAVDQFSLGKDAGTESGFFNGYVQEVILYEDDIYADRIGIENHINDYYNAFLSFDKFISSLVIDDEEYGPLSRSINIAREFNKGLVTTFSQARPFNMYAYEFS